MAYESTNDKNNSSRFNAKRTDSNISNSSQKALSPRQIKSILSNSRVVEPKQLNSSANVASARASLQSRLSNKSPRQQSPRIQISRPSVDGSQQPQSPSVQHSRQSQSPRNSPGRAGGGFSQSYYPGSGSPRERFIAACCTSYKQQSPKRASSAESVGEESTVTAYVPRQYYVNTGHIRQRLSVKFPSGVSVPNVTGITACQPPRPPLAACLPTVPIRVPSMHSVLIKGASSDGLDLCSIHGLQPPPPALNWDGDLANFECSPLDVRIRESLNEEHTISSNPHFQPGEEEDIEGEERKGGYNNKDGACDGGFSVECVPLEASCPITCKLRWVTIYSVVVALYAVTFYGLLVVMCANCLGNISIVCGVVLMAVLGGYDALQARDPVHLLPPRDADLIQRLRTGRTALLGDMRRAGLVASARCGCGAAEESAGHVMQECRRYGPQREAAWPQGGDLYGKLYGSVEQLQRTARFFDETGLRGRLEQRLSRDASN